MIESEEQNTGKSLMEYLKTLYPGKQNYTLMIPQASDVRLRMVSTVSPEREDVNRLTLWRNRHSRSFLTEFYATPDRTRKWLIEDVGKDLSRVVFMIEQQDQLALGYLGLAFIDYIGRSAEADSVVRGEPNRPGIMSLALNTLISWGRTHLLLNSFRVRVFSDNPALAFYKRLGFEEVRRIALRRLSIGDFAKWQEFTNDTKNVSEVRWLVHMELRDKP